jgi:hypothetical protein
VFVFSQIVGHIPVRDTSAAGAMEFATIETIKPVTQPSNRLS